MTDSKDAHDPQLFAIIEGAVSAVPQSWRERLTKTFLQIIGVKIAPRAARQISDELDTLAGRRLVATEMAKAVAKRVVDDPEMMERATQRFYGMEIERQHNLEAIAQQTIEEFTNGEEPEVPEEDISPDWRRKFTSYAGDVSEPEMQRVWAKMLAGEVVTPGSFSLRTLRLVSELDRTIAEAFAEVAKYHFCANALFISRKDWSEGEPLQRLALLEDSGLTHNIAGQLDVAFKKAIV